MAEREKTQTPPKSRPGNSCFLTCFGFGDSVSCTKKKPADVGLRKKKLPWISWRSSRKRKSGSKTVPVDVSVSREGDSVAETREVVKGVSDKTAGKRPNRAALERKLSRDVGEAVAMAERGDHDKSRKTKHGVGKPQRSGSIPTVERCKIVSKDDTCPTTGSRSRPTVLRKTGTRPNSPETEPSRSLTVSSTFPPPGSRISIQKAGISRLSGRRTDEGDDPLAGKFDPVVGMSILIVTLAILLLWGKFCAVVCTSAWLYFIPRLKMAGNSCKVAGNRPDRGNPDVDSSEYKKKVVLEGLLERNHRNPVAGVL